MSIDIKSLLMGKAMGGGGGSGSSDLAVWNANFFGKGSAAVAASIVVNINGYKDKYALISVMHRDTITAPSGCTLLDKSTFTDDAATQYVSIYKCLINSESKALLFSQASSERISATAWIVDRDFELTKKTTNEFQYYKSPLSINTSENTFFTFSAYYAQQQTIDVIAKADGAWLNTALISESQLRHFTGMIPRSVQKTTEISQTKQDGTTIDVDALAQVVTYTISQA